MEKNRSMLEVKQEVNPMFIGAATLALSAVNMGIGLVKDITAAKRAKEAATVEENAAMDSKLAGVTSSGGNRTDLAGNNVNMSAMGGEVESSGTELQEFNEGGTHEQNPQGGIMVGMGENGKPNTVEEGETKYGDFIFTARVPYTYDESMPKFIKGETFAEASKSIDKAFKGRNDVYSSRTKVELFKRLSILQETAVASIAKSNPKAIETGEGLNQNQYSTEGRLTGGESMFNNSATTLDLSNYDALKNYKFKQDGVENYDDIQNYKFKQDGVGNYDAIQNYSPARLAGLSGPNIFGNMGPLGLSTEGQNPSLYNEDVAVLPKSNVVNPTDNSYPYSFIQDGGEKLSEVLPEEVSVTPATPATPVTPVTPASQVQSTQNTGVIINDHIDMTVDDGYKGGNNLAAVRKKSKEITDDKVVIKKEEDKVVDPGDSKGWLSKGDNMSKLAAGIGVASQTVGIISSLIGKKNMTKPKEVTPYTISKSGINPNLVNRQAILREVTNQESTTREAIAENSSGDFGAYASNVAGVHAGSAKAKSRAMLESDIADSQEKARVQGVHLGIDQYNASAKTASDEANAQNEAAYETQRLAYDSGIAANIGSMGETLMNYGIATQASKYAGNAEILKAITELNK